MTNEEYHRLWIERCDRSYDLLTQTSEEERSLLQGEVPGLFLYGAEEDLSTIYYENNLGELFAYSNKVLSLE